VAELRPRAKDFEAAGARLVIVGNGWPAMARDFAAHAKLPENATLLVDPGLRSYAEAGLRRSALLTLGPRGWIPYLRTMKKGFRQGRTRGDPWQQGGALVIARGGQVLFRHVSTGPADQADPASLVAALARPAA
jgi:alkyl-hydroperoxide reductase/thiol specific antioxidant family protein